MKSHLPLLILFAASTPAALLEAQNDQPAVRRQAENLLQNDQAQSLIKTAKGAASDDEKRQQLINKAQSQIQQSRGASETTPVATPAPAPAAQPLIPDPVASTRPAATPPAAPAPAPARPAASPPQPATATPGAVPPPQPLRPRYREAKKASKADSMEITAHESVMDENNNMATFAGNVIVHHPGFKMTSDHLEIELNDKENPKQTKDGKNPPFEKATATGAMVIIERVAADGTMEIAKARTAVFDGITGDTVLYGGPPILQRGAELVEPRAKDAQIFLTGDGRYHVKGESTMTFQLKGGPAKSSGPNLPGGSLDSLKSDRSRSN